MSTPFDSLVQLKNVLVKYKDGEKKEKAYNLPYRFVYEQWAWRSMAERGKDGLALEVFLRSCRHPAASDAVHLAFLVGLPFFWLNAGTPKRMRAD